MNRFLSVITCLAVLAHSTFGCCRHSVAADADGAAACECHAPHSHHSHETEAKLAAHLGTESEAAAGFEYNHRSSPIQSHVCRHGSCHWMTGGSANSDLLLVLDVVAYTYLQISPWAAGGEKSQFRVVGGILQKPTLALRLHLEKGVLLI